MKVKTTTTLFLLTCLSLNSYGSMNSAIKEGQKTFFGSKNGDYKDLSSVAKTLMDEGVYFAAIPFMKEALYTKPTEIDEGFDKILNRLILEVGRDQFSLMDYNVLKKSNSPAVQMVLAKKYYLKKNYSEALKYLNMINGDSDIMGPALMLKAHLLSKNSKFDESIETYKLCITHAEKSRSKFDDIEHLERSYQFVKDSCNVSVARVLYKAKKFEESSKYYRAIPKTSYKWPSILLEDAWNSYRLKDYNR